MMKPIRLTTLLLGLFLVSPLLAGDHDAGKLVLNDDAPGLVKITFDARLRYEYGEQTGLDDSDSATLRTRLGLLTRNINGFQGFVEYEGTVAADPNDYFVPGTQGDPAKTPVVDPESHELNQAWLSYTAPDDVWTIKGGRQAISLDNQRYVGGVAWRQNMQTFDAVTVGWSPTSDLDIFYGYVWQVNRIFGSDASGPPVTDFGGQSHLINAKYKGLPYGVLTGYVYALDLHNDAGDIFSSDTVGFHLTGDIYDTGITYWAEYAHQIDAEQNPRNYEANYAHGWLSKKFGSFKTKVGLEYIGSDNGNSFQTPLGTNHAFNGFADRFVVANPPGGLTDIYASVGTNFADINFSVFYHYFHDDGFDVELGHEVDVVAVKKVSKNVSLLGKAAWFFGSGAQPDITRVTAEMNIKY